MKKKPGREDEWAINPHTGKPIVDLKQNKTRGTYYHAKRDNGKTVKTYFGNKFDEAYSRFLKFIQSEKTYVSIPVDSTVKEEQIGNFDFSNVHKIEDILQDGKSGEQIDITINEDGNIDYIKQSNKIDELELIDTVKKMMIDDFDGFRRKIGLPIYLDYNIKPLKYDCQKLLDNFINLRNEKIKKSHEETVRLYWGIFSKSQKGFISDVTTPEDILRFYQAVYRHYLNNNSRYNAISTVRTILNHNRKLLTDIKEKQVFQNIADIFKNQKNPQRTAAEIQIIEPEHLHLIISKSTLKFKLMWMLCLNIGIREVDLKDIEISDFDLKNEIYRKERTKNGVTQTVYLLPDTIKYLKLYLDKRSMENIKGKILFYNNYTKERLSDNSNNIYLRFKAICKKCKLIENYSVKNLRQGVETISSYENIPQYAIDIVMGHVFDGRVTAAYKNRDVRMTKSVYNALFKYYFNKADMPNP